MPFQTPPRPPGWQPEFISARCNAGQHEICNVVGCVCECHETETLTGKADPLGLNRPHVCGVVRIRSRKPGLPRWSATCEVCGPLAKPYEDEAPAKRRAILHAQAWAQEEAKRPSGAVSAGAPCA